MLACISVPDILNPVGPRSSGSLVGRMSATKVIGSLSV